MCPAKHSVSQTGRSEQRTAASPPSRRPGGSNAMKRILLACAGLASVVGIVVLAGSLGGTLAGAEPLLVAHWPFDGDYNDYSGNGHHGTPSGDPEFVTGVSGQALNLDGDGDYVTVGDSPPGLDGMTELTIDLWLYVRSYPSSKTGLVAKFGPAFTSDDSYELSLWASGQLEFKVFDGRHGTGFGIWKSDRSLPTAGWVHITATWHPTADVHIYWDGVEESIYRDPCPNCAYDTQFIQDTDVDLWIGRYEFSGPPGGNWLDGIVDDVRIYASVVPPPTATATPVPPTPTDTAVPPPATPTRPTGVGGIVELPAIDETAIGEPASGVEGSGWSAGTYAGVAGGVAAGAMALAAGAWYARRRWAR